MDEDDHVIHRWAVKELVFRCRVFSDVRSVCRYADIPAQAVLGVAQTLDLVEMGLYENEPQFHAACVGAPVHMYHKLDAAENAESTDALQMIIDSTNELFMRQVGGSYEFVSQR